MHVEETVGLSAGEEDGCMCDSRYGTGEEGADRCADAGSRAGLRGSSMWGEAVA